MEQRWIPVLLFLAAAGYNWLLAANTSRATLFFGLACLSAAVTNTNPSWVSSALAVGGIICFAFAFLSFVRRGKADRLGDRLGAAIVGRNLPEVRHLLDGGANPNALALPLYASGGEKMGLATPLMVASAEGSPEIVAELLTRGARVDDSDVRRWTALFFAAESGHQEICRLLLQEGANPNSRSVQAATALMVAVIKGHTETVRVLLEHGAQTAVRDSAGKTAADLANKYYSPEIIELLASRRL